jgi:hypothetical protein
MSVDEHTRHQIHGRFEELLGPELAGAFMSYLPPVGWADVATKRDLDHLAAATKRDVDALAAALDHHAAATERDLDHLGDVLKHEIESAASNARADLHQEVGQLRTEVTERLDRASRNNVLTSLATVASLGGMILATAQLA